MCDSKYITLGDAARALGLTKPRISQLISQGRLSGALVDGRKQVLASSVENYRSGRSSAPSTRQRFTLMSADYEVARLTFDKERKLPMSVEEIIDPSRMPFGTTTSTGTVKPRLFNNWWGHRSIPTSRPGYLSRLSQLEIDSVLDVPVRNLGLSLSDCYWIKPDANHSITWSAINYFDNSFTQDNAACWDTWLGGIGLDSPDNTSEGELPKRWAIRNGQRLLIKGCSSDDQRPYNEVIATALHRRLLKADEYVPYELVQVRDGIACACPNFLNPREEFIPAYYLREKLGNTRGKNELDRIARWCDTWLCDKGAMQRALSQMVVCDFILANTDRHWRNFGFIRSVDTLEMRPAPLFDSGNSLWYAHTSGQVSQNDWAFASKPFDANPFRQLSFVDDLDWFDADALEGFADEAGEILVGSSHATESGRLSFIKQGLTKQVANASAALNVLRWR